MGTGKTLQSLAVAMYYHTDWPLLIVVPSSVKYNWADEVEKWLPGDLAFELNIIRTGKDIDIGRKIPDRSITIISYGLVAKLSEHGM